MRRHGNTWFKLVALVLALSLILPILVACGSGKEEEWIPTPAETPTPESTSTPTPLSTPAPSIAVTSPNGGENWVIGTTQIITWTSMGLSNQILIALSRDGGASWRALIVSIDDGNYAWTVTGPATTRAKIRLVSLIDDSNYARSVTDSTSDIAEMVITEDKVIFVSDVCDAVFSITQP